MSTNVSKNNKVSSALDNVTVEITAEEKKGCQVFFQLIGMKTTFLDSFKETDKGYTLRKLNYALETGSIKMGMLTDLRAFIEEHKAEVEEFLKENAA